MINSLERKQSRMNINNGYIISESSTNPQQELQKYFNEIIQHTKIIFAIIWGENEIAKTTVSYADDISEPGNFNPDGYLYKVIYIPKLNILESALKEYLKKYSDTTSISTLMGMTYSQAHNRIINVLSYSENITPIAVREMYLSK
jgi:hypothetical protein